jgi:hypothetical protein
MPDAELIRLTGAAWAGVSRRDAIAGSCSVRSYKTSNASRSWLCAGTPGAQRQPFRRGCCQLKKEKIMSWPDIWRPWQPPLDAEDPDLVGGMSQLGAYDAGLTDDPGC